MRSLYLSVPGKNKDDAQAVPKPTSEGEIRPEGKNIHLKKNKPSVPKKSPDRNEH